MKLKVQSLSQIIISIVVIGIVCISPFISDPSLMFLMCCLVFFLSMGELLKAYRSNISILCYYFSMFTFLIGGELCKILGWTEQKYDFSNRINCHAYFSIILSVVCLFVTYVISTSVSHNREASGGGYERKITNISYRKTSLVLYYVLSIFKVITIVSEIIFTRSFGYTSYYTDYIFSGPTFILKLSDMSSICFFVFLSTMPSKKETNKPMILFVVLSTLTLLVGYRNEFVVNILFAIIYFVTRDTMSNRDERWIAKKSVVASVVLAPVLLTVLYGISYSRINNENNFNIIDSIINFFDQQGFSINIIKWEKELHDSMPAKPYSIGQLCDFFRSGNIISKFLFSAKPSYKGQTIERALNGNQLSYYLSYAKFPWDYSMGYGVGSSFIAEAFHDLGYFGIALFSSIYGFVFSKFKSLFGKNVWVTALFIIAMTKLLMAPRSYADAFIAQILDLTNIETFLIIYLISKAARRNAIRNN